MEAIVIETKIANKRVLTGCIYRAPNTDIQLFNDELQLLLELLKTKSSFLCGDYNIDLLKSDEHHASKFFIDQLFSYGYYPLINLPTRITTSSCTLIDNIYTNVIGVKMKNGLIINDLSDHLTIYTMIDYSRKEVQSKNYLYKYVRLIKKSNLTKLSVELHKIAWNDI